MVFLRQRKWVRGKYLAFFIKWHMKNVNIHSCRIIYEEKNAEIR